MSQSYTPDAVSLASNPRCWELVAAWEEELVPGLSGSSWWLWQFWMSPAMAFSESPVTLHQDLPDFILHISSDPVSKYRGARTPGRPQTCQLPASAFKYLRPQAIATTSASNIFSAGHMSVVLISLLVWVLRKPRSAFLPTPTAAQTGRFHRLLEGGSPL